MQYSCLPNRENSLEAKCQNVTVRGGLYLNAHTFGGEPTDCNDNVRSVRP